MDEALLEGDGELKLLKEYHEAFVEAVSRRDDHAKHEARVPYSFDQLLKDWDLAVVSVSLSSAVD